MDENKQKTEAPSGDQAKDFDIQEAWAKSQGKEADESQTAAPAVDEVKAEDPSASKEDAAVENLVNTNEDTSGEDTSGEDTSGEGDDINVPDLGFDKSSDKGDDKAAKKADPDKFDEEAFDAETEAEVEGMEDKERAKWKSLKQQLKEAKKSPASSPRELELESQLSEMKEKQDRLEELELLNKQLTEDSYELAVKSSDAYANAYELPVAKIAEEMKSLAESFGLDEKSVARAIGETNPRILADKIDALMPDEDEETGESNSKYKRHIEQKVSLMAADYNKAIESQQEMLEDAKSTHEANQLAQAESKREAQTKSQKLYRLQVKEITDKYAEVPVSEANKKQLKGDLAFANSADFDSVSTENKAFAMASAAYAPTLLKENAALRAQLRKLDKGKKDQAASGVNLSQGTAAPAVAKGKAPSHEDVASSFGISVGA